MLREKEFRKVDDAWIKKVEAALSLKLYLVSELGPSHLVFKDDNDQKFRVKIGPKITCTCQQYKKTGSCLHILFCLIKVFKVDRTDDLLFAKNLTPQNVNQILDGRFKKTRSTKKKFDYLRRKNNPKDKKKNEGAVVPHRHHNPEDPCPICYEDLADEGLYHCPLCDNAFHLLCLLQWAKHQVSTAGSKGTQCPMCRGKWDSNAMTTYNKIQILVTQHQKREFLHRGVTCGACGKKDLIGKVYKSVKSYNLIICERCFARGACKRERFFLMKEKHKEKWRPSFDRIPPALIGLSSRAAVLGKVAIDLETFLIAGLPSCSESDAAMEDGLGGAGGLSLQVTGFHVDSRTCKHCGKHFESIKMIKRLPCGHKICVECLYTQFKQKNFSCVEDGIPIFKGLVAAMRKTKLAKKPPMIKAGPKKEKSMLQVKGMEKMNKKPKSQKRGISRGRKARSSSKRLSGQTTSTMQLSNTRSRPSRTQNSPSATLDSLPPLKMTRRQTRSRNTSVIKEKRGQRRLNKTLSTAMTVNTNLNIELQGVGMQLKTKQPSLASFGSGRGPGRFQQGSGGRGNRRSGGGAHKSVLQGVPFEGLGGVKLPFRVKKINFDEQ